MQSLSQKQSEIYEIIKSYQECHGYPPTQEEIAGQLNLARETVRDHLRAMEKKGYISRKNSRHLIEVRG